MGLGERSPGFFAKVPGRHEAYFKSVDKQTLHLPDSGEDITLDKGELLNIEWSYKVSYPLVPPFRSRSHSLDI